MLIWSWRLGCLLKVCAVKEHWVCRHVQKCLAASNVRRNKEKIYNPWNYLSLTLMLTIMRNMVNHLNFPGKKKPPTSITHPDTNSVKTPLAPTFHVYHVLNTQKTFSDWSSARFKTTVPQVVTEPRHPPKSNTVTTSLPCSVQTEREWHWVRGSRRVVTWRIGSGWLRRIWWWRSADCWKRQSKILKFPIKTIGLWG